MPSFEMVLQQMLENLKLNIKYQPLFLGGVASVSGGTGGPPGGFIGYLPQNRVAYDTAELASSGISVSGTLLDNLNHIRYRIASLESGTIGVFSVFDNGILVSDTVNGIDFGDNLDVTMNGDTAVITAAAGSGTAITNHALLDNLNSTYFYHLYETERNALTLGNNTTLHQHDSRYYTEGEINDLLITVSGITVQESDGSPVLTGVNKILFTGGTVTSEGTGIAKVTIAVSGIVVPYLFGNATIPTVSGFSWVNQGDAVATDYDRCITVTIPIAADNSAHMLMKSLPASTNYQITIGMNAAMLTSFHRAGIALRDSSGGKIIMGGFLGSDLELYASVLRWTDYSTWDDIVNSSWTSLTKPSYFRIKNDGTYNTYYHSIDGVLWFQYYQEAYDAYMVANQYGIVISPDNDTYPMGITVFHFLYETI